MTFVTIQYPEGQGKQYIQFRYPGGEVQTRLILKQVTLCKSVDSIHIVARITDGDVMPVMQLIDAVQSVTASDIKLIMPYLPYSRADRRFTVGDCYGLSVFGRFLNSYPDVEIFTLDAHSKIAENICIQKLTNIDPKPIIDTVIDSIECDERVLGVMLPDAGAARYGICTKLVAEKKRKLTTGELLGFRVPPEEAFEGLDSVLIIDDICDGGGTFLGIADEMKDYGLDLYLYVTHGIFSKGHTELLKRFKKIYTTDSFGTKVHADPLYEQDRVITIPCIGIILDKIVDRPALWEGVKNKDLTNISL